MVLYYEQKEPIFHALLAWTKIRTIFGLVLKRFEFWFFIGGHCTAMAMFKTGMWDAGELGELSGTWEAVSTTQMFMVFLLTFYNGHCYDRYLRLYYLCCDVLDGSIFFVQELVVALSPPRAEQHRIRAVKYIVAIQHLFFVGLTGGMKSKKDWREIVNRGLLTKLEAEQLQIYPSQSIETVLVVATWTMQIIDKALEDDAFWTERSMRVAHTHNRMSEHMTQFLHAMHQIGDELACPIPFPMWHLMNVVLAFNLFLLCTLTAVFKTYQTVFPLMISVMFFLGLREVAANLSDPFHGRGFGSDFPIADFLQFAFDGSVCLLEAFRHGDPDEFAQMLVKNTKEFTNEQLSHSTPNSVIYKPKYDPVVMNPFSWHREKPLVEMTGFEEGPEEILRYGGMVPAEDDMPKERKKRTRILKKKPTKRGFLSILLGRAATNNSLTEIIKEPEKTETEKRLERLQKKNAKIEEEISKWDAEVNQLRAVLEHRLSVGRDLGLPVDEILAKALNKTEEPKMATRDAPQFTSFDEASRLMVNAANK